MFGIGGTELFLILLFAFLIFGPDKLPGMGRTIGRALRQFRHAQEGFTQVVQSEVLDPATEAMNANPNRPNRKRAEEFEEDADIEAPEGEQAPAPRRTETFAERKKRLAAEKAARDAEAAAAAAAARESADAADEDADLSADSDAEAPAPASAPEPAPAAKKPTASDLYAMKRPARAAAPAESAESAEGAEASLDASCEASEAQSAERRAGEGDPVSGAAPATDEKKEA